MKRIAVVALILFTLALTGCDHRTQMEICIEAGGSFSSNAWGASCTMPGAPAQEGEAG